MISGFLSSVLVLVFIIFGLISDWPSRWTERLQKLITDRAIRACR
jgi:hypothetical protein